MSSERRSFDGGTRGRPAGSREPRPCAAVALVGAVALSTLAPGGGAFAQAAASSQPVSSQEADQIRSELNAIRADSEAARAQEKARERQIDELQRRLDAATGVKPAAPEAAGPESLASEEAQIAAVSPAVAESNPEEPVRRRQRIR